MARILIIADTFPPNRGGSEALLEMLAEGLGRNGHAVKVVTPAVKSRTLKQADVTDYSVKRSRIWFSLQALGGHPNYVVNRLSRLLILVLLYTRFVFTSYDVILAGHIIPGGRVGVALARSRVCKALVVITYGEEISMYQRGPRMLNMMRKTLRDADAVTALTESNREELELVLRGIREKTVVVPPAVRLAPSTHREPTVSLSGCPIILTLSRLVERKGMDTTIKAVDILKAEFPDIRYYIVGTGPYGLDLHDLVESLNLQEHVQFLGMCEAPDHLLAQCDIFSMPNRELQNGEKEGFGMVFLEAGLMGKPSIGGRSGGAVEAVLHNKTGLIVTPDDPVATADAIRLLSLSPEYRIRLGEAARHHAQQYSTDRLINAYEGIISQLLKSGV